MCQIYLFGILEIEIFRLESTRYVYHVSYLQGCIALADAVSPAGSATAFRECIASYVEIRTEFIEDGLAYPADHPDILHRDAVLERLLGASPSDVKRKMILKFHFNAGFLKHSGPVLCKRSFAVVCAQAIFPAPYSLWKRSRWVKTTRPIREICLLFAIGSLGPYSIRKWLGSIDREPDLAALAVQDVEQTKQAMTDFVAKNRQARVDALTWSSSHPGPRLMLLISGLSVGVAAMDTKLVHGSIQWRLDQASNLISNSIAPEFGLVEAAKGTDAIQFFEAAKTLLDSDEYWRALPSHEHTHGAQATAFAVISVQILGMHFFYLRTCTYPWKLWRILGEPQIIPEILRDRWCIKCEFTQDFLTKFPTPEHLSSFACRAILIAMAVTIRLDTFPIENRFGWLRRWKGLNTTTHEQELLTMSSFF
jgi:hypothetical protein